jgi:hypothetical protein
VESEKVTVKEKVMAWSREEKETNSRGESESDRDEEELPEETVHHRVKKTSPSSSVSISSPSDVLPYISSWTMDIGS